MCLNFFLSWSLILILGYLTSLLFFKKLTFSFRLIVSFGFGTGITSILMILLGLLYNFQLTTVLSVYSILFLILLYLNRKNLPKKVKIKLPEFGKKEYIKILIALPFVFLSFFQAVYFPELYEDAMIYDEVAQIYFNNKAITFIEGGPAIYLGYASGYPPAFQLLQSFFYLFTGESILFIRLLSSITLIFFLLLVYYWAKDIFKKESVLLSLFLFITLPITIFFSRLSAHYLYLSFQFSLAAYFLYRFLVDNKKEQLFFSAIFAGFAALTSYLGLIFLPILLLSFIPSRKNYKQLIAALIIFSLVISPWYLRNLITLNNPLWPFGGGKYIDEVILKESNVILERTAINNGFTYSNLTLSLHRLFYPIVNLNHSYLIGALQPILTILTIPAIIYWFKERNKKMKFFVVWFLTVLLLYIFFIRISERYLVLAAVPTVFLSVYILEFLLKQKFFLLKCLLIILLAYIFFNGFFVSLFSNGCYYFGFSINQGLEFFKNLNDKWGVFEVCYGNEARILKYVNEKLPENASIATTMNKIYYFNRTFFEMDSWKLRKIYYNKTIENFYSVLKNNNISYIVVADETDLLKKYTDYFLIENEEDKWKVYRIV